jgi:hypothetical protein
MLRLNNAQELALVAQEVGAEVVSIAMHHLADVWDAPRGGRDEL